MPILESISNQIPELTLEQKQEFTRNILISRMRQMFAQVRESYVEGYNLITKNPYGLTPEQVFEGLKDDALETHRLGSITVKLLNEALPGTIPDEMTLDKPTE